MPRRLGHRAVLAPTRHAPVHEPRIAREANVRTEPQPFHHAGTEAFDERVRSGDEFEHGRDAIRILQIHRDALAPPRQHIRPGGTAGRRRAVDANHFRAHVGQHHSAERTGTDALQFDDFQTGEGTHASIS